MITPKEESESASQVAHYIHSLTSCIKRDKTPQPKTLNEAWKCYWTDCKFDLPIRQRWLLVGLKTKPKIQTLPFSETLFIKFTEKSSVGNFVFDSNLSWLERIHPHLNDAQNNYKIKKFTFQLNVNFSFNEIYFWISKKIESSVMK